MIKTRTVLILGAGASQPYGFPVGYELFAMICNGKFGLPDDDRRVKLIAQQTTSFQEELKRSGQTSVDAFLERRDDLVPVGKYLIAATLIPFESEGTLFETPLKGLGQRWYRHLFGALNAPPGEFGNNALSVITFNYDRSLEHFLATALSKNYQAGRVGEELRKIPIIHVHGSLGEYGHGRMYSPRLVAVSEATTSIRIVHEAVELQPAHQLLSQAEQVIFLGFGYGEKNIERLQLDQHVLQSVPIRGSAKGMTDIEKRNAESAIGRQVSFDNNNFGALDYLRHHIDLR